MRRVVTFLLALVLLFGSCLNENSLHTFGSNVNAESQYETLKPGSKGQAVLDARMRLYELGYFSKVPTQTEYTTAMMDYVKKFEKDYGLKQDGILSPEDQEVLFRGEIVTFNPNLSVGDRVTLGKWEQDNKTNNGKEPIQWQVLAVQGDRALIITVDGIDTQCYGTSMKDTNLCWETSSLRKWMNETFYSAAFSENEKAVICLTSNDNGSKYSRTDDRVFCMSVAEAGKYFSNASAMACKPTAYAKSKIGKTNALDSSGYGIWWLRDMASTYKDAGPYNFMATTYNEVAYVNMRKGIVSKEGMIPIYTDCILARPAMWINFKEGFIDTTGKLVIPCQWDDTGSFSEGLAWVKKDGKWGVIDTKGNIVFGVQ